MQILQRFMLTLPFTSKFFSLVICYFCPCLYATRILACFLCTFFRLNQELIKELSTPAPGSKDLSFPTKYSQSIFVQCKACFWKQYWSYWRHPQYNAVRFFLTIIIGVLFGLVFWNKGNKTYVILYVIFSLTLLFFPFLVNRKFQRLSVVMLEGFMQNFILFPIFTIFLTSIPAFCVNIHYWYLYLMFAEIIWLTAINNKIC